MSAANLNNENEITSSSILSSSLLCYLLTRLSLHRCLRIVLRVLHTVTYIYTLTHTHTHTRIPINTYT